MAEVIAAIIGVLLGALIAWWLSRMRPHVILCEDAFQARLAIKEPLWDWSAKYVSAREKTGILLDIGLPETSIMYKDQSLSQLMVIRFKFRSNASIVIEEPSVKLDLGKTANILGWSLYSNRGPSTQETTLSIANSELELKNIGEKQEDLLDGVIHIQLGTLYPYTVEREEYVLDVFCSGEIDVPKISGRGQLADNSVWVVRFESWENTRRHIRTRVRVFNYLCLLSFLIATTALFIWHPPRGVFVIDIDAIIRWMASPFFLVVIFLLLAILVYAFVMFMRDWYLGLPIPFAKRYLIIYFKRKRQL